MQSNVQLISAFVFTTQIVQYLFFPKSEFASLLPSPVAFQLGLCPTWLETRTRFDVYEILCPNRCLYIMVAKLRTGVGNAETPHLQNCSVIISKENCR